MLILSWNVASWTTTVAQIKAQYGDVPSYLDRHHVDILCLQETKITVDKLKGDPTVGAANIEGWDSFWCCCRNIKKGAQGFNGVATFARKGLTLSANSEPFGDGKLDQEGRCIMTDHGVFVIFNVYTPTNGSGNPERLLLKWRFLQTLRERMKEKREENKAVILLGDLNIARRKEDVFWKDRMVSLDWIDSPQANDMIPVQLLDKLRAARIPIESLVKSIKIVKIPGKTHGSGGFRRKIDTWKVTAGPDGKITLGKRYDSPDHAQYAYNLAECRVVLEEGEDKVLLYPANRISVGNYMELIMKSTGEPLTNEEVDVVIETALSYAPLPFIDWMDKIMRDDMVDAFAHFHGDARERFTCWDQYTNRRYENEGARIDYTFVDRPFFDAYVRSGPPLKGIIKDGVPLDNKSPRAALWMATAGGLWEPAPYDGSGMVESPLSAYESQFVEPHTGVVYTPPKYSDHVAVSLWIDHPFPLLSLLRTSSTIKAQPHTTQRTITSLFSLAGVKPKSNITNNNNISNRDGPVCGSQLKSCSVTTGGWEGLGNSKMVDIEDKQESLKAFFAPYSTKVSAPFKIKGLSVIANKSDIKRRKLCPIPKESGDKSGKSTYGHADVRSFFRTSTPKSPSIDP